MSSAELILDQALAAPTGGKSGVERLREELLSKTADVLHRMADRIYAADLIEPEVSALGPRFGLDNMLKACLRHAESGGGVSIVPLHLYSLQELKLAFGTEWPRLSSKAMKVVEIVLRKRLGPADTFLRHADNAFVVYMGGEHAEQAPQRASRILGELRQNLLGPSTPQGKSFGIQLERVTFGDLLSKGISPEPAPLADTSLAVAVSAPKVELSVGEVAARLHKQLSFSFSPVWAPGQEMVTGYQALARRHTDYGIYRGKWVLNGGYEDPFSLGVDLRIIEAVAQQITRLQDLPTLPKLSLPLHNRSLLGRNRDRILQSLDSNVPKALRAGVVPEIVGILDAHPLTLLPDTIAELRALFGQVHVRILHGGLEAIAPHLGRADGIGIDMNELGRHGATASQRRLALKEFGAAVKALKVKVPQDRYVWDLHSAGEIKLATAEGFTIISGAAVGIEDAQPRAPFGLAGETIGLKKGGKS